MTRHSARIFTWCVVDQIWDDDGDGAIDEDPFDGVDSDGDGAIDEDPAIWTGRNP